MMEAGSAFTEALARIPEQIVAIWNYTSFSLRIYLGFLISYFALLLLSVPLVGRPLNRYYNSSALLDPRNVFVIVSSNWWANLYLPGETKASIHSKLNRFQIYLCYYLYGVGHLIATVILLYSVYLAYQWISPFGG